MRTIHRLSAICIMWFAGCINPEYVKYAGDWPRRLDISHLTEIEGLYENDGKGAGDRLWFYLTKEQHSNPDCNVSIAVREHELVAELMNGTNLIKSHVLKENDAYKLENGRLVLNADIGGELDPLASGVGYTKYELILTKSHDIAGKRRGVATGLILNVIPALGWGRKWTYWQRIQNAQAGGACVAPEAGAPSAHP